MDARELTEKLLICEKGLVQHLRYSLLDGGSFSEL